MPEADALLLAVGAACALIALGGGLYEFSVLDPAWPKRPDLIQPGRGGVSRKRFWIPAHAAYEIVLIACLVATWSQTAVRFWLLVALGAHAAMRIWSAFDFIPKALDFERAEPSAVDEQRARRWTQRSLLRLPLDIVTCVAMLAALMQRAS